MKDKSHIIAIFSIIFVLILVALISKKLLQPDSFDKFGHYRWKALSEIENQKIINQNIKVCAECHNDIYQIHQKDAHYHVPCVDCHGAGDSHVAFHRDTSKSKSISKKQAEMPKKYNLEGCLFCHRKLAARPSDFPQIDKDKHFKFLKVTKPNTKCTDCHSPHQPIFLLTDVKNSRLHPIVYRCNDCHSKPVKKDYSKVEGHPKIFECKDCHAEIVKEFKQSPHNEYVECRTCHLFHKEDETIGRIYKNGNARFCLLCHEKKSFKDEIYPPKIVLKDHIKNLNYIDKMNEKLCLNCHQKQIHSMSYIKIQNPHNKNWRIEHKKFALVKSTSTINTTCISCHSRNFCIDCHKLEMPHTKDFLDSHLEIATKKGSTVCYNCHKKDFCNQCHN